MRLSFFRAQLAAVLLILAVNSVSAQLILEFGDPVTLAPISSFQLQPNEVRTIAILLNNTGSVGRLSGETLELGIGGGGVALGGIAGPAFTAVDLVTGTPFANDHGSPTVSGGPNPFPGIGSLPQYLGLSLNTASAAVPPETVGAVNLASGVSLLATLTVSAAGFSAPQSWSLAFVGAGSSTFFNDAFNNILTPTFQNSTISVVPEPASSALVTGIFIAGLALLKKSKDRSGLLNP